jgi:hypothetical protein
VAGLEIYPESDIFFTLNEGNVATPLNEIPRIPSFSHEFPFWLLGPAMYEGRYSQRVYRKTTTIISTNVEN